MKNIELNADSIKLIGGGLLQTLRKYASVIIFVLFTGIYGYFTLQINALSNPDVDEPDVAGQTKALALPHIDEDAAKKLQSLEDNSVNVQTIFEQGRADPFQ